MKLRRAFTLIELLVVIAIIAILAAILFPVFAQAKKAAKAAADISNLKQLNLGILIYVSDYDDTYPDANGTDLESENLNRTWIQKTAPYVKNLQILQSPLDSRKDAAVPSWAQTFSPDNFANAVGVSYSPNSYVHSVGSPGITGTCPATAPCPLGGIMNPNNNGTPTSTDEVWGQSKSTTAVTQPASTVALADMFSEQRIANGCCGFTNLSAWFTGTFMQVRVPGDNGINYYDWFGGASIPNGTLAPTNSYPSGPNGSVSLISDNKANFAFTDGHVKSMDPRQTNPDPIALPQQNMWNADR
jgi:prepilin-type N-terminal cleavage/methylation domain-containing protein/prepilin-type processing-associated H-X9-DG protein